MLEAEFDHARRDLAAFVLKIPKKGRLVGLHDVDADGVAAGVVWQRILERAGFVPQRLMPDRQRNAWTRENRAALEKTAPETLFVLDLGGQETPILPGVPTCFIDHHRPEGTPPGDLLISGYAWNPIPNTSWMMWELAQNWVEVSDLDWIAVIGTLSDLGEKAPWDLISWV